jgi:hypothetical protein
MPMAVFQMLLSVCAGMKYQGQLKEKWRISRKKKTNKEEVTDKDAMGNSSHEEAANRERPTSSFRDF